MSLPPELGMSALEYIESLDSRTLLPRRNDLWGAVERYRSVCGGLSLEQVVESEVCQRAGMDIDNAVNTLIETPVTSLSARLSRVEFALKHAIAVLEELAQRDCSGHDGNEETGEHYEDCMRCKVDAAIAHAEDVCNE